MPAARGSGAGAPRSAPAPASASPSHAALAGPPGHVRLRASPARSAGCPERAACRSAAGALRWRVVRGHPRLAARTRACRAHPVRGGLSPGAALPRGPGGGVRLRPGRRRRSGRDARADALRARGVAAPPASAVRRRVRAAQRGGGGAGPPDAAGGAGGRGEHRGSQPAHGVGSVRNLHAPAGRGASRALRGVSCG